VKYVAAISYRHGASADKAHSRDGRATTSRILEDIKARCPRRKRLEQHHPWLPALLERPKLVKFVDVLVASDESWEAFVQLQVLDDGLLGVSGKIPNA